MAARFLFVRKTNTSRVRFVIWLDTSQTLPDGSPNPLWVREYIFHRKPPEAFADFKDRVKEEAKRLALDERARLAPTPEDILPEEGTDFP